MQIFHSHLPFSLIADIVEGRATADPHTQAHLDTCSACGGTLTWLSQVVAALRADESEEPPAPSVGAVKALFRSHGPRPASVQSAFAALLRFDSARAMPAFGIRSAPAAERQLLFSAGPYDVDLRVSPDGERWAVAGQLLGNILGDPGEVEVSGPADSARAQLSPESEFFLRPVRAGMYRITISLAGRAIVLDDVELGA